MALRVSGQDDIIINLPQPLQPDELLDLEFDLRRTAAGDSARARSARAPRRRTATTSSSIQPLPSYIYTGRSGWYPQGEVTDYATATLRLRVPEGYSTVASGALDEGYPQALPPERTHGDLDGVPLQRRRSRCAISAGRTSRFVPRGLGVVLHHTGRGETRRRC